MVLTSQSRSLAFGLLRPPAGISLQGKLVSLSHLDDVKEAYQITTEAPCFTVITTFVRIHECMATAKTRLLTFTWTGVSLSPYWHPP